MFKPNLFIRGRPALKEAFKTFWRFETNIFSPFPNLRISPRSNIVQIQYNERTHYTGLSRTVKRAMSPASVSNVFNVIFWRGATYCGTDRMNEKQGRRIHPDGGGDTAMHKQPLRNIKDVGRCQEKSVTIRNV